MNRAWALATPLLLSATAVFTAGGRRLDTAGLEGLRSLPEEWVDSADRAVRGTDAILAGPVGIAIGSALVLLVLVAVSRDTSGRLWFVRAFVALGGAVGVSAIAKAVIPRPVTDDLILTFNSLPSGHAAAFAAGTCIALFAVMGSIHGMAGNTISAGALRLHSAALSAAVVSWSFLILVTAGHRPADVIASLVIVEASVALVANRALSRSTNAVVGAFVVLSLAAPAIPTEGTPAAVVAFGWIAAASAVAGGLAYTATSSLESALNLSSRGRSGGVRSPEQQVRSCAPAAT